MNDTVKLNNCPKCGAPIPAAAPQGLCPKCVLAGVAQATEGGAGLGATATGEIPSLERVAAAFPQLEILELIGRGGMGFVFKARQPHLDRFVALKLLPDKLAKDPQFAERFNREGRVLARLNHPGIVSVYDFGQTGGFYFLLMEYVDGVNLRQAMQAGRFSPGEALAIVPRICEALQYAHEQGILHRDIKPENLLLDAKGRVKIADFGIAKLVTVGEMPKEVTLTGTGAALGTPHYMAPEQLEKPATVDHRADIYSLGVVFYEMLTGELPIGRFAAPSSKTPVNSSVDAVVFRTLEKDRERRFQTAGEMKTQVEELGEGPRGTSNEPALPPAPAPRWLDRLGLAYCLIGGVQLVQSLMSLGTPLRVFHLGSLLLLTGLAMLFRRRWLRSVALALNAGSLVLTIPQMIYYWFGSPKPGWSVGVAGWPSGVGIPWLPWVLATLQILLFVAGLYVLLRREIAALFIKRPTVVSGISTWAITGAVLVGLSLPAPLMILLAILSGGGGIGLFELWVALGSVALPGLGGTLLGWLGLNEIRESHGRLRGLPLAMFATLFWPLGLFVGLTLVFPMYFLARASEPSAGPNVGRVLVLLLPAAVIAFSFWSIHATARWATQKPTDRKRGILKWIFVGAIVVGMGLVMMTAPSRHAEPAERPQPIISFTPVNTEPEVPQPIQANFRIPKGQAVTFMVLRRDAEPPAPIASFAGFVVAPDEERSRCSILLTPEPALSGSHGLAWRIRTVTEDGASVMGSTVELGELISLLPTNHLHAIEPDSSFELLLTGASLDSQTNQTRRAVLSLAMVSQARGKIGAPTEFTRVALGSTNWAKSLRDLQLANPPPRVQPGEVLAHQWLKSPVGTNTTNWIRYTFTNVELRKDDGKQWLAMDYATHVQGDCEVVFRADSTGFTPVTRKTGLLVTPEDAPAVLRERVEWLVPPGVPTATLEQFRDSVAEALVGKSFVIPEGEQRPLLRFPIGNVGDLSVGIGAKRRLRIVSRDSLRHLENVRESLEKRERELSAQFTPENPQVLEARRKINEVDRQIEDLRKSVNSSGTNAGPPPTPPNP